MTELDPLELELSAMRPHQMSHEAKQRIADRLSASPLRNTRPIWGSTWLRGALAIGALAASVTAVIFWRGDARTNRPRLSVEDLELDVATAFDRSLPSVWSYGQALIESPQAFEGLLDAHSIRSLQVDHDTKPPAVLAQFVFQTDASSGEL